MNASRRRSSEKVEDSKTGYGTNNIQECISKTHELLDPKKECKCGANCFKQFDFRPIQESLLEKSKLTGAEFKTKIIAELVSARRFKPDSNKLFIEMKAHLTFRGISVCKEAYQRLHFIPLSTWDKWHAKVCGCDILEDGKVGRKPSYNDPTNKNWSYFAEYASQEILPLAEPQPQHGKLQMNPLRPADCFAAYQLMRKGVYQVEIAQFKMYLREYLKEQKISIRKRKDCAGKCNTREELTKQRREVNSREDLQDWKDLTDSHTKDYRSEREAYNQRRADGTNVFGTMDSYGFDGAANNNTICPHSPVKVKSMSDKAGSFFHLHLQAVVMHGFVLYMCLLMPWVPRKDVNMCLTTFNILLRYVVTKTSRFFRPACHVQMDGGSENWNKHLFAFFCIFVHHGLYEEIWLHRLTVGHSHNDLDGFFGLLKMLLWGKTADKAGHWFVTLGEWICFLKAWVINSVNKQISIVGCNLDFKSWIDPHVNPEFGGHAGRHRVIHTWRFYVAPDLKVRAMYKFGDRFEEWLPPGVESDRNLGLIICTSYPAIDSAPDYIDNPAWFRKGKGGKNLDMETTTRSCLLGLCAATPKLVSQEQHDELEKTFPLPLTVQSFEVCYDGIQHKRSEVEAEAVKHINVKEVEAFMRQTKYNTELISRRSENTDGDDEESSSSDVDESLAARKKRLSDLAEVYTFDDMTPGSFAVTVAGGEENDKCWFTVLLPGGGKSVPLHFVEVVAQHPNKKEITWQFWLPAKRQRVFNNVEDLCVVRAFVRGPRNLRIKAPFDVHEMLTSWDDMSVSNMVPGGVPAGAEKAELLKALVEHRVV
ncbi:hypothetical protein CYMTET_41561 [Cymbomonas tetramitiformis]|uniref:DUF7869 domain-containing protein n=1 Tax=Cymbomonas tetramitiformis TaxID=36881 RepID=A0AAE0C5Y9_9CHLO|nr:hypothetical protein CYMTET_41561 [Cymbomonas tetramitiformis]